MEKAKIKNLNVKKKLLLLLLTSTLVFHGEIGNKKLKVSADDTEQFIMRNDYVTTIDSVNLRNDDSLFGEIICTINDNVQLKRILSANDNWNLVIYNDKLGFVQGDFIKFSNDSNDELLIENKDGFVIANTGINLRLGPSTNDKIIGGIANGCIAEVIGKTNDNWYLVSYNGQIGYVSSEFVDYKENINFNNNSDGKLYGYVTTNVNFRIDPTVNSDKIETINKDEKFEILSQEDNGWFKIIYNDQTGYISDKYVTFNPEDGYRDDFFKVVYATDQIELKNEQNNNSFPLYEISKYETCEVLADFGDQYLVRANNCIGYIPKNKTKDLDNIFVVVDISSQKLTLYNNNQIILETDIVTGTKWQYDTPTGIYSIRKKETDTYLSGEDYYVHIDYWMPFNNGIGLHDADWRNKFGGTIYQNNGSHGCVNIPEQYADDIYYSVEKGTKVLVQK